MTSAISACTEEGEWTQAEKEEHHNWYNVSGLVHAQVYEFVVVAHNRRGDAMKSEPVAHTVGFKAGQCCFYFNFNVATALHPRG